MKTQILEKLYDVAADLGVLARQAPDDYDWKTALLGAEKYIEECVTELEK